MRTEFEDRGDGWFSFIIFVPVEDYEKEIAKAVKDVVGFGGDTLKIHICGECYGNRRANFDFWKPPCRRYEPPRQLSLFDGGTT